MCGACTRTADAARVHQWVARRQGKPVPQLPRAPPPAPPPARPPNPKPAPVSSTCALAHACATAMRVLTQRLLPRSASCGCFESGSCTTEAAAAAAEARAAATSAAGAGGDTAAILSKLQAGRRRCDAGLRQRAGVLKLRSSVLWWPSPFYFRPDLTLHLVACCASSC